MSGHTPGPWCVYPETDGTEICAVDIAAGLPIRQVIARPVRGENWIYNARLIAAAPELLEALQGLLEAYIAAMKDGNDFPGRPWTAERDNDEDALRAQQVIAKAGGQ